MKEGVIVITGASRGLGAGMAERMRERGHRLGLCARSQPALAAEPGGVLTDRVDVRDAQAVGRFCERVASELGPIDLWINNAGVLEPITFTRDVEPEAFGEHLSINVSGVLHGSQAYVRHCRERGREGVLVNISSGAAKKPYQAWGAYCAAKAAVDRLTEVIALEEQGVVRAHAVAPGVIDTEMQRTLRSLGPEQFPMVDKFLERKAEGRFNTPPFVADHLLALAFAPEDEPDVVLRLPEERG